MKLSDRLLIFSAILSLSPYGGVSALEPEDPDQGITLYLHASFRGRSETFYGDDADLSDNPIGNDRASSVVVPPGCTVMLYEHGGYQGKAAVLRDDRADLSSTEVGNDAVSSVKVSCESQPPAAVSLPAATESVTDRAGATDTGTDRRPAARGLWSSLAELAMSGAPGPELVKKQTVMITVISEDEDQSVEHGAGVVLCEENRQAYVLTAHHVLAGDRSAGGKTAVRHSGRTEIQFFGQSGPGVVADGADGQGAMTVHQVPEADLALLSIPALGDPWPVADWVRSSEWARAVEREEPAVLAVGFRGRPMEAWATEQGSLLPGDGELLHHSAPIVRGFSGGPLFHRSGNLIGINLRRIAGETIGAEAGGFYGEALAIERILPLIRRWLPASCLRTLETAMETSPYAMEDAAETSPRAMETAAFRAEADKMRVVGSGKKIRFGPYRITDVRGGAVRQIFSRTRAKRKYRFLLDESNGTLWQGECIEKIEAEEAGSKLLNFVLDQLLDESLVVAVNVSLSCTFGQQGGGKTMELVLDESDRFEAIEGAGKVAAVKIEAAGTGSSTEYLLLAGDGMLGAVVKSAGEDSSLDEGDRLDESDTVWLGPSVTGETRSACAAAAAALLLHSRFEMESEGDQG